MWYSTQALRERGLRKLEPGRGAGILKTIQRD